MNKCIWLLITVGVVALLTVAEVESTGVET